MKAFLSMIMYWILICCLFVDLDDQLWKLTDDSKLINKSAGTDWEFGSNFLAIEDGFVIDRPTGNVFDIAGGCFIRNPVILHPRHGGDHQKWEVVPTDDWMKLRNPASGLCLQVTNDGHLTVLEGGIHILLGFPYLFFKVKKVFFQRVFNF